MHAQARMRIYARFSLMICDSESSSSDDGMFFPALREDDEW
jgi:hypothetical protein